jgi:hypothetical protein
LSSNKHEEAAVAYEEARKGERVGKKSAGRKRRDVHRKRDGKGGRKR